MKAILIHETGGIEKLVQEDVAPPTLSDNEVLVEVKAIGINPVDYKVRRNEAVLHAITGEGYPAILGWDIAGEVVATGSVVEGLKKGDRVFGMVNFPGRGKAYADYVAAPENHLTLIPDSVDYTAAAATTLAALTAFQAFRGRVQPGDKVLIQAGSGGVGHFAIQLAKNMGAQVITTCSAKNQDFVKSLGADIHIDYQTQAYHESISDVDFVLDCVGGEQIILESLKVTKQGGQVISIPSPEFSETVLAEAKKKNINLSFILVESNGADMNQLGDLLEKGLLKPHVSHTFTFEEMDKAHTQQESARTVGKIVVTK